MLRENYPYYLENEAIQANTDLAVRNKYSGDTACRTALAGGSVIDRAISAAANAAPRCRELAAYERADILRHVAKRIAERGEELAYVLAIEAGKPIRDARGEATRAIDTFRIASEEATRIGGEYMPLDVTPRARGCEGIWKRVPVGACSFITPFNFPLNLAAHKIAPAIAAGCPFVLKPASATPVSALLLGEILAETALPKGAFSILPCGRDHADQLTTDPRVKLLSFTGSAEVGWTMKTRAGKKKVVLELGGNAACMVDRGVDLDRVISRLVFGAFYQSGQSCISVQRILIHESIYETVKAKLAEAAAELKAGDPLDEQTFLGPLITEDDAKRLETWVADAVSRGANTLCGDRRHGSLFEATLLENVPDDAQISCEEAFGPVAVLESFASLAEACERVNAGAFGLQAGVFTQNLDSAFYAFDALEVGAVIVNDVPSFRVDSMPYGGVKDSGFGREGVRFSIEEMTEMRLLALSNVGKSPPR